MNTGENMLPREREVLNKVRAATHANPFDRSRLEIDLSITGLSREHSTQQILNQVLSTVSETIATIFHRGETIASQPNKEDEELVRFGILFHVFHLFCNDYDVHIERQIAQGDLLCDVEFAREALRILAEKDISEHESIRFFSLFFQMRRAFFFISAIAGQSPCVMEFRRSLWNNIFTSDIRLYDGFLWDRMEDFSTMILGETGTGKGMAAAAIGRSGYIPFDAKKMRFSESFAKAFIPINLSQFPEELIESELFGHKKGAFTGAVENHSGIFSRCSPCGAIFLDEIGDVRIPIQIKLLQILQERCFTPVGSHRTEKFQGRVIAATNKPLDKARAEGMFRDDFYYRLCSDVINVPSLKKRIEQHPGELKGMIDITLARILGKQSDEIADRIHRYIEQNQPDGYGWPGNIRELEQCVRSILLNTTCRFQPTPEGSDPLLLGIVDGSLTSQELVALYCKKMYGKLGTYESVSRLTGLDRRTVKKYILSVST